VPRSKNGPFNESDDVGRSLRQDVKRKAKAKVKPGYGDKGDASEWSDPMTKSERADLLKRVGSKLDEAATILKLVEEKMLCEQVCELADLIHVEIEEAENAEAA
jgi:hypothetical protein